MSLFNLPIPKKKRQIIMRGNGNQELESHLGDTEPGPCLWPKVTSASHNIFAPPSLSLKQTNPIPQKSRRLPDREHHPAQGRGIWVQVSFEIHQVLGHAVLSSRGFRVTSTRSRPSWMFLTFFPAWEKGKLRQREGSRSKAAPGCSVLALRRQHSKMGISSEYFW